MAQTKALALLALLGLMDASAAAHAESGVYAGGSVYRHRSYAIDELKDSGFTHVVVWTIHIEADGSLGFNGEFPLVHDGAYIGDATYPNFRADVASLKAGTTSITRVEFGLSSAGSGTYANVRNLLSCTESHCGTGPDSILYQNFRALRTAFPTIDALNNDDETTYDLDSAVPFHVMLADVGFNTAIVPYTQRSFWQEFVDRVNDARPGSVDLTYLQAYAGGSGNTPCDWDLGIPVFPGLWSTDESPSSVQGTMQGWKNTCGIAGGFMWLYDEFGNSSQVAQYAGAINSVFDGAAPDSGDVLVGVPRTGLSGGAAAELRYRFEVPANATSVSVSMSGASGDADLYVNYATPPTVAAGTGNDCRPHINGNVESCSTELGRRDATPRSQLVVPIRDCRMQSSIATQLGNPTRQYPHAKRAVARLRLRG